MSAKSQEQKSSSTTSSAAAAKPAGAQQHKRFSLQVFKIIKRLQTRSGVKDRQYKRHHRSCTKAITNTRRAVKLCQSQGQGRAARFKRVAITPENCSSPLHLSIPLLEAERAWAHAMELQSEITEMNKRKRQHMNRRFARAAHAARRFLHLANMRGDVSTQLQAQVYEGFIRGSLNLQKENWKGAVAAFTPALRICEALGKVSNLELQALCDERASQLRLYLGFASDRLARIDPSAHASLQVDVGAASADDLLQAKLQAVMEANAKAQTTAMRFVESRGTRLEVRNEKLRLLLVEALSISNQIRDIETRASAQTTTEKSAPGTSVNALFNRLLSLYDDAILVIKDDIRERGNVRTRTEQIDNEIRTLRALLNHAEFLRLQTTLQRNIRNANSMRARVLVSASGAISSSVSIDDAGEEYSASLRPAALVTVYDRLLQNLTDLEQLATSDIDPAKPEQVASAEAQKALLNARRSGFLSFRVYFLALAHGSEGNSAECAGLLTRALERATQAEAQLSEQVRKLSEAGANTEAFFKREDLEPELEAITTLKRRIMGESIKAKAKAILEQELLAEQMDEAYQQKQQQQQQQVSGDQSSTLLGRLNKYETGNPGRQFDIVAFPPKLAPIAPKPTLFDLAVNGLDYPDLSVEAEIAPIGDEEEAPAESAAAQPQAQQQQQESTVSSIWKRFSLW